MNEDNALLLTTDSGKLRLWKSPGKDYELEETPDGGTMVFISEEDMREIVHYFCREWSVM